MPTTDSPIFKSVQQCLHFSFLMEAQPATYNSRMHELIKRTREASTINFEGLTALEVRGQCAIVRKMVMRHLSQPEIDAIHAWYGHQECKAGGVHGIRDYHRRMISTQHDEATLAIAWSVFARGWQRKHFSTRKIAKKYGLSQSTVMRDVKVIADNGRVLEGAAIEHLTPIFESKGLIEVISDSTPQ